MEKRTKEAAAPPPEPTRKQPPRKANTRIAAMLAADADDDVDGDATLMLNLAIESTSWLAASRYISGLHKAESMWYSEEMMFAGW